jgi:hypothetical protein
MSDGLFLVPQTVFVGDEGRLVVPLAGTFPLSVGQANVVITDRLPFNENIIVKRVEIDIRAKQFLLDFTAFKPGVLEIPQIDAVDAIKAIKLPPLKVEIASILEREGYSITLSPPEKPLAAPGTFALIIGGTAVFIVLIAATIFLIVYGPKHFRLLLEKLRVRFLMDKTKRAIMKIQNALVASRIGTKEGATAVGVAFKAFLGALYRKDYAAYSAEDFLADTSFSGDAAYCIFALCDNLRFSPAYIEQDAVKALVQKTLVCVEEWMKGQTEGLRLPEGAGSIEGRAA